MDSVIFERLTRVLRDVFDDDDLIATPDLTVNRGGAADAASTIRWAPFSLTAAVMSADIESAPARDRYCPGTAFIPTHDFLSVMSPSKPPRIQHPKRG